MTKNSMSLNVDPSIIEDKLKIVQETPIEQELNNIFESIDTVPCRVVRPNPGFCLKTFTKPDNKKIFVNVCTTDAIPPPRDITSDQLKNILNSDDPSNYRLPMSLGEGRTEHDKSGAPTTVYDVAIHPDFFDKLQKDQLFKSFFLTVAFEGLQDKYQMEIDMQNSIILRNRKSFGTLQSHRIQIRDIQPCQNQFKTPIIEEIYPNMSGLQIVHRLTRLPVTGNIQFIVAEYKIPPTIVSTDLSLEAGEDRIVLECKRLNQVFDTALPYNIAPQDITAELNRNFDVLSVKMPVI